MNKYLEYYMDSKKYSEEEVEKSINETKKEFPNKKIDVEVYLNNFGVYVITFKFNNKNSFLKSIFIKIKAKRRKNLLLKEHNEKIEITENEEDNNERKKRNVRRGNKLNKKANIKKENTIEQRKTKQDKIQKRFEKYYGNKYGQYKNTGTYRPY